LILSKEQFGQNIRRLSKVNEPFTEEEQKLRNEIVKLYEIEEKMGKIINPIIKEINSGSAVINYFAEVLVNRMTERSIFDITKEKYLKQLEPVDSIDKEIKNQMKAIKQIIPHLSDNLTFPRSNENKAIGYINNLENHTASFHKNREKLIKAENYYIELETKIGNLSKSVRDWIEKRKEEKKYCLGTCKGYIKQFDPNNVENPFDNNNSSGNYNKKDYYSPNPTHNNINYPQNYNNQYQSNDDSLDQPYCSANIKK